MNVTDESKPATSPVEPTTSEVEHAENSPPPTKRTYKRPHKSNNALWLIVIVLLAIGGGVFYALQVITTSRDQLRAEIDSLKQQQQAQSGTISETQQGVSTEVATLHRQQDELANAIEIMRNKDKHLRKDWLINEAEYLIQLANYRVLFDRDINTAVVALNAADLRLKDTGDPALINVRKQITASVQALKQIEQVDLAGLSLSLSSVNKDLDKLPLNTPDPIAKEKQENAQAGEAQHVSSWKELPAAIWRDIKSLIVIRDHAQPVAPMLTPEERFFLIENLRLQLEQARLAMLAGQPQVYSERLTTAIDWISTHFDKEATTTKVTLETLKKMQAAPIAPALPDISAPYQALQKYRAGLVAEEKTSTTPEVKQ